LNVEEDVAEGSDGVSVAPHHHVRESDVVVHGDLAAWNTRVKALLVQLHVLQNLDGLMEVSEKAVKTKQSDQGEVSHHLVKWMASKFSGNGVWVSASGVHLELLVDVALVHHGVQDVQDLKETDRFFMRFEVN